MRFDRFGPTAELIGYCLDGRREAWDALIIRYQDYVNSVIAKFLKSDDDRQDVFQNVFVILYRNLRKLRDREKLASYLFQIARRECLRVLSLSARSDRLSEKVIAEFGFDKETETPESFFEHLEEGILIRQAVRSLKPRCRVLLKRLFLDDCPPHYDELAEELGIPVASVGPTRQRCLARLRDILEKMEVL